MSAASESRPRIALLGLGMLGTAVQARLGPGVTGYDLPGWDLTRDADLERAVTGADVVVNCAAYTDVDGAEANPALAFRVNAEAVGRLGRLAARCGAYVLHVSTDFVFDGAKADGYVETDAPNPLGVYGASKLAGERELAAAGGRHGILRLQWTYGARGRHFMTKIVNQAGQGGTLRVVADQVGSPTWTGDAADAVAAVVAARYAGVLHYAARGAASRCAVAQFVVERLGLPARVEPCASGEFAAAARRPLHSTFACTRFDGLFGLPRPDWRVPLARFLETLR
jgi:dTDP-4-dehydrorhamnose reductase